MVEEVQDVEERASEGVADPGVHARVQELEHAVGVAVLGAQEQVPALGAQRLRQPAVARRPGLLDGEAPGDRAAEGAQSPLAPLLLVAVRHAEQTAGAEAHLVPCAPAAHPDGFGETGARRAAGPVGGPEAGEQRLADQWVQVFRLDPADAQQVEVGEPAPERLGQEGQALGLLAADGPRPETGGRRLQQDAGAPVAGDEEAVADALVRQPADLPLQAGVVEREPAEERRRIGPVPAGTGRGCQVEFDPGGGEGRLDLALLVQQGDPLGPGRRVGGAGIGGGQFVRTARSAVGVEEGGAVRRRRRTARAVRRCAARPTGAGRSASPRSGSRRRRRSSRPRRCKTAG
ncbi:hypothetical protein GCM10023238_29650 [Streptomyces heliomycini]